MLEQVLFEKARNGCRTSLVKFLDQLETDLYQTAYYLTEKQQDAMQATQDALIYVYQHIEEIPEEMNLRIWKQRLIVQSCLNLSRQKSKVISMMPHLTRSNMVKKLPGQISLTASLKQAIYELPERLRFVLVLRYIQELSIEEITEVIELPIDSIKMQLYRARKQLQEWLREYQEGGIFQWQIQKSSIYYKGT